MPPLIWNFILTTGGSPRARAVSARCPRGGAKFQKPLDSRRVFCYNGSYLCERAFLCCLCANPKGTGFRREGGTHRVCLYLILKWEVPKNMANEARVKVTLVCSECKQRNYDTKKNKKNDPDRLEFNKYCPFCKKHTLHKESK